MNSSCISSSTERLLLVLKNLLCFSQKTVSHICCLEACQHSSCVWRRLKIHVCGEMALRRFFQSKKSIILSQRWVLFCNQNTFTLNNILLQHLSRRIESKATTSECVPTSYHYSWIQLCVEIEVQHQQVISDLSPDMPCSPDIYILYLRQEIH